MALGRPASHGPRWVGCSAHRAGQRDRRMLHCIRSMTFHIRKDWPLCLQSPSVSLKCVTTKETEGNLAWFLPFSGVASLLAGLSSLLCFPSVCTFGSLVPGCLPWKLPWLRRASLSGTCFYLILTPAPSLARLSQPAWSSPGSHLSPFAPSLSAVACGHGHVHRLVRTTGVSGLDFPTRHLAY